MDGELCELYILWQSAQAGNLIEGKGLFPLWLPGLRLMDIWYIVFRPAVEMSTTAESVW